MPREARARHGPVHFAFPEGADAMTAITRLPDILLHHQESLVKEWLSRQQEMLGRRGGVERDDREAAERFLRDLGEAARSGNVTDTEGPEWSAVREFLSDLARDRARQGFSPPETAAFVFSLKQPLFDRLRQEIGKDSEALASALWQTTLVLDRLGLYTTEVHQKTREEVISRQQQELLELSTPVVQLWDGLLALPLIGTLDSSRTQVVMESLLHRIVETGAGIAIIDITGVPTVDTLVAQHLLKTVSAARLMGADCIISGIRPQIAQTIVHLGVELGDVTTKATLAGALAVALARLGLAVTPLPAKV
jgi:rsbT co-antagonist protein RsbR